MDNRLWPRLLHNTAHPLPTSGVQRRMGILKYQSQRQVRNQQRTIRAGQRIGNHFVGCRSLGKPTSRFIRQPEVWLDQHRRIEPGSQTNQRCMGRADSILVRAAGISVQDAVASKASISQRSGFVSGCS